MDRFSRITKERGLAKALSAPINEADSHTLGDILFGDSRERRTTGAYAAMTFGDVLFDMAAIDPRVLAAADFSRVEDYGDRLSFSDYAEHFQDLTGRAALGAASNLQGYVAEQYVASRLIRLGHQVSFPEASNQPGFDLIVDGEQFQVKCGESTSILLQHFDKYPEIPVLTNDEIVADVVENHPELVSKVFAVDGFSLNEIESLLQSSVDAGAEVLDYEIPAISAIVLSGRTMSDWWNGDIELKDAFGDLAAGLAAKTGLGTAGALAGKATGLALFGPAGAVVFGGVLAVAAASQSRQVVVKLRQLTNRTLAEATRSASADLAADVARALEEKKQILSAKLAQVEGRDVISEYVRQRLSDQLAFSEERGAEARSFDSRSGSPLSAALNAIDLARRSRAHLVKYQRSYMTLLKRVEELSSGFKSWGPLEWS